MVLGAYSLAVHTIPSVHSLATSRSTPRTVFRLFLDFFLLRRTLSCTNAAADGVADVRCRWSFCSPLVSPSDSAAASLRGITQVSEGLRMVRTAYTRREGGRVMCNLPAEHLVRRDRPFRQPLSTVSSLEELLLTPVRNHLFRGSQLAEDAVKIRGVATAVQRRKE